mmetsp:Transcript_93028/g.266754  ORF Transcript_93028/g.266754 Transcript_93028/m.266754 type:complete len:216 (-) Transcript_93028:67-714(-)|eukprot:CAMPEP_0177324080 /NCGR_PEP_ID=MMETSP0368-20130122/17088_1 /TAXON_ID=447022 ORGANISM="Scrippsiella hangoei-like, Strain SHHI-4" /NCGR_SAMPLE_ID=MMETSP0368 /ASSEMBLY_ACC=CAM_ASM_000363 /LENGTH=215 /DNA_ID=CAMNT_0018783895 /DNA_START=75 /DNA_END=722 /DNA_ORIENTATION=-
MRPSSSSSSSTTSAPSSMPVWLTAAQCGVVLLPAVVLASTFFSESRESCALRLAEAPQAPQAPRSPASPQAVSAPRVSKLPRFDNFDYGETSLLQMQQKLSKTDSPSAAAASSRPPPRLTQPPSFGCDGVEFADGLRPLGTQAAGGKESEHRTDASGLTRGYEADVAGAVAASVGSLLDIDADLWRRRLGTVAAAMLGFGLLQQTELKSVLVLAM